MKKILLGLLLFVTNISYSQEFRINKPIGSSTAISTLSSAICSNDLEQAGKVFQDADGILKLKSSFYDVSTNGATSAVVAQPTTDFSFMPFDVYGEGTYFYPDRNFVLRTNMNVTKGNIYYVNANDPSASDANGGLSWDDPLRTINGALGKTDPRTIYITGYFHKDETTLNLGSQSIEIIGVGDAWITSDHANAVNDGTGWTLAGNTWSKTVTASQFTNNIIDRLIIDECGRPSQYSSVADPTTVDATDQSYHVDWAGTFGPAQTIYINTLGNREPDSHIALLDNLAAAIQDDNESFYIENVNFLGTVRVRNSSATGGLRVAIKDCSVQNFTIFGVDEFISWNCRSSLKINGDVMNYDERNGLGTNFIEYRNIFTGNSASGVTNSQISTGHGSNTNGVRIWCMYNGTGGQVIADVTGSKSWNLGVNAANSGTSIAYYTEDIMYLDGCNNQGNATDFDGNGAGQIFVRNYSVNSRLNSGTTSTGTPTVASY